MIQESEKFSNIFIYFFVQSMGKSLTFRGAVFEAQDFLKFRRCKDAVCDSQYQLLRNQLMSTYSKMKQLEKELELRKLKSEKR